MLLDKHKEADHQTGLVDAALHELPLLLVGELGASRQSKDGGTDDGRSTSTM